MRNQGSERLNNVTKATKLVSEELSIKATGLLSQTCKDLRTLIPMSSGGSRISKTDGFRLVIGLERDFFSYSYFFLILI